MIVRLTRERKQGRKENSLTNKRTNKVNFKNEGKQVFLPGLLKSVPYRSITGRLEKDMPDICVQLNKQTNKILKRPNLPGNDQKKLRKSNQSHFGSYSSEEIEEKLNLTNKQTKILFRSILV